MGEHTVVFVWLANLVAWIVRVLLGERKILLGTWYVKSRTEDYVGTWSFRRDHTVTAKWFARSSDKNQWNMCTSEGHWEFTDTYARITWKSKIPESEEPCWDRLQRPIKPDGVCGDSWNKDYERWTARKLHGF